MNRLLLPIPKRTVSIQTGNYECKSPLGLYGVFSQRQFSAPLNSFRSSHKVPPPQPPSDTENSPTYTTPLTAGFVQTTPSTRATPWLNSFQDYRTKKLYQPLTLEKPLHSEKNVLRDLSTLYCRNQKRRGRSLPLVQKSLVHNSRLFDPCALVGTSKNQRQYLINNSTPKEPTSPVYRGFSETSPKFRKYNCTKKYWEYKVYDKNNLKRTFFRSAIRSATEKLNIPTIYRGPKLEKYYNCHETLLNYLLQRDISKSTITGRSQPVYNHSKNKRNIYRSQTFVKCLKDQSGLKRRLSLNIVWSKNRNLNKLDSNESIEQTKTASSPIYSLSRNPSLDFSAGVTARTEGTSHCRTSISSLYLSTFKKMLCQSFQDVVTVNDDLQVKKQKKVLHFKTAFDKKKFISEKVVLIERMTKDDTFGENYNSPTSSVLCQYNNMFPENDIIDLNTESSIFKKSFQNISLHNIYSISKSFNMEQSHYICKDSSGMTVLDKPFMTYREFVSKELFNENCCSLLRQYEAQIRFTILSSPFEMYYTTDFLSSCEVFSNVYVRSNSLNSYFFFQKKVPLKIFFGSILYTDIKLFKLLFTYQLYKNTLCRFESKLFYDSDQQKFSSLLGKFQIELHNHYINTFSQNNACKYCSKNDYLYQNLLFIKSFPQSNNLNIFEPIGTSSFSQSNVSSNPSLRPVNSVSCLSDFIGFSSTSTSTVTNATAFKTTSTSSKEFLSLYVSNMKTCNEESSTSVSSLTKKKNNFCREESELKESNMHFILHIYKGLYVYRIRDISDFYILGPTLGSGAEGHVKICIPTQIANYFNISLNEIDWSLRKSQSKTEITPRDVTYAIKITPRSMWKSELDVYSLAHFLGALRHPNVLNYLAFYEDSQNYYFLMDLLDGPELLTFLLSLPRVTEQLCREVFRQILSALNYIHNEGLVHRDVKLENFVCKRVKKSDGIPKIKLIDFGLACYAKDLPYVKPNGTALYMAPELLINVFSPPYKCTQGIDIWAAGIILCQLLTGQSPFEDGNPLNLMEKVKQSDYDVFDNVMSTTSKDSDEYFEQSFQKLKSGQLPSNHGSPESVFSSLQTLSCCSSQTSESDLSDTKYRDLVHTCLKDRPKEPMNYVHKRATLPHIKATEEATLIKGMNNGKASSYNQLSRTRSLPMILPRVKIPDMPYQSRNMNCHKTINAPIVSEKKFYRLCLNLDSPEWMHVSESAKTLVRSLLSLDPAKRPTAAKALEHEWFKQTDEGQSRYSKETPIVKGHLNRIIPNDVRIRWENFLRYKNSRLPCCKPIVCINSFDIQLMSHPKAPNVVLDDLPTLI